jgi:uncharacterized membrane protein YsdA (DUF1294 family)
MWKYVLVINTCTFLLFGYDKSQAVVGAWRVPEWQLLTAALAGGWVRAKAGQLVFRHKTRKQPFGILLNLVPFVWVIALESFRRGLTQDILTQQASLMDVRAQYVRKHVMKMLRKTVQNIQQTYREEMKQIHQRLSSAWSMGIGSVKDTYTETKERIGQTLTPVSRTWQRIQESVVQRTKNWQTKGTKTMEVLQDVVRKQPKETCSDENA